MLLNIDAPFPPMTRDRGMEGESRQTDAIPIPELPITAV